MFKLQDTLILAMILLSSGDLLLCFAEIMHLQRLLAAMNLKLLLLPIYHLWGYVTYVALKVALVYSCLRHYLSKKYIHRYAHTHTHTLFSGMLYTFLRSPMDRQDDVICLSLPAFVVYVHLSEVFVAMLLHMCVFVLECSWEIIMLLSVYSWPQVLGLRFYFLFYYMSIHIVGSEQTYYHMIE